MASGNGTVWKIVIGVAVTVAIAALASVWAGGRFQGEVKKDVAHNHEEIQDMKPDVKQNTEHRIKFEEKVNTMAESIETIRLAVEK